jgi:hypothetical protein
MLFADSSPLRRISADVDTRTILFLDGIRYSIDFTSVAFHRIIRTIKRIATLEAGSAAMQEAITEVMADAWLMIDAVHRLRELVQQLPGLKQKEPAVQAFYRATEEVKEFRNYVQHLSSGIEAFVEEKMPLWGVLSWTGVNDDGQPENDVIVPGTAFGFDR